MQVELEKKSDSSTLCFEVCKSPTLLPLDQKRNVLKCCRASTYRRICFMFINLIEICAKDIAVKLTVAFCGTKNLWLLLQIIKVGLTLKSTPRSVNRTTNQHLKERPNSAQALKSVCLHTFCPAWTLQKTRDRMLEYNIRTYERFCFFVHAFWIAFLYLYISKKTENKNKTASSRIETKNQNLLWQFVRHTIDELR